MKKYLIMLLFAGPLLLVPAQSSAEEETVYIDTISYTLEQPFGGVGKITSSSQYFNTIYRFALGIVGIIAVVLIMFGGLRWMAAAGNESIITEAKEIVTSAATGLAIALLSYVILAFINPRILIFGFAPAKISIVDDSDFWKIDWCNGGGFKDQQCTIDGAEVACNDVACTQKGFLTGAFCRGAVCELGPGTETTNTAITVCYADPQNRKTAAKCQPKSCADQVERCWNSFPDDEANYNICLCGYYDSLVLGELNYTTTTASDLSDLQETTYESLCEEQTPQQTQAVVILANPSTFGYTGGTGNIEDVGWNCGFSCSFTMSSECDVDDGATICSTTLTCT